MLDDRERRMLAEMEQMLALQDPGLDARQRRRAGRWAWRWAWWPRISAGAGVAVPLGLMMLGLPGQAMLIAALGALPLMMRHRPQRTPAPPQDTGDHHTDVPPGP